MIFIDTNIFYNILFKTEITEKARKVFKLKEDFATSFLVVNELIYVSMRKIAENEFGIKSYESFKNFIAKRGYNESRLNAIFSMINDLNVRILEDYQNLDLVKEVMIKYRLLPQDALIAATCKYYRIKKIATFDEDFKRVDFLEIVDPSQM